jgi:hypothetical protein
MAFLKAIFHPKFYHFIISNGDAKNFTYYNCQLGTINKLFAQEMFEILQWHRVTYLWYLPI